MHIPAEVEKALDVRARPGVHRLVVIAREEDVL